MESLNLFLGIVIFVIGLLASFIGTSTGGSALFSIPALIFLGFQAPIAIATVKLGALGTLVSGLFGFHKAKKVDYAIGLPSAVLAILGSFVGASILVTLSPTVLERIAGIFILLILAVIVLKKAGLGNSSNNSVSPLRKYFGLFIFFLIGVWGGIFAGQGVLATYAFLLIFHKSFLESAGTRKITGLGIAITALLVYGFNDLIHWKYGLILLTGTLIGSHLGTTYSLHKGDAWVQKVFLIVVLIMAVKLVI
jgi:uncharacterized protein